MTEEEMKDMSPYEKVKFLTCIDGIPSDLEGRENLAMFWFGYIKALMEYDLITESDWLDLKRILVILEGRG